MFVVHETLPIKEKKRKENNAMPNYKISSFFIW
jgi:hypothetical protein